MIIVYDPDSIQDPINPKDPFNDKRGLTGRERFLFYYTDFLKKVGMPVRVFSKFTCDHNDGSVSYINRLDVIIDRVVHFGKFRLKYKGQKNILVYPFSKSSGTARYLYKYLDVIVVPNDVARWTICDGLYLPLSDVNKFRVVRFSGSKLTRGTVEPKVLYLSKWDKGAKEILSVWPAVHSRNPHARLIMPGLVNELNRYAELERDFYIEDTNNEFGNRARFCKALLSKCSDMNIEASDRMSVNDILHHIETASAVVYPARGILPYSYHASSVYDAYVCGTPVIAQGTRSLYEYENKHIEYVDMENRESFADSITAYLQSPKTYKTMEMKTQDELHRLVMQC